MAGEISTLYKDEPLVVVCVLKGAFMFFSDLVRHLTCKPELDFVRLASYGSAAQRSKTITFTKDVEIPLEGKHVLIVEDIVDTGHSMDFLYRQFTLPSGFVVGYGLDYAESYRELPAIYEAEIEE